MSAPEYTDNLDQEAVQKFEPGADESRSSDEAPNNNNKKTAPTSNTTPRDVPNEPKYHLVAKDRPMPEIPGSQEDYEIVWLGEEDPEMPVNWNMRRKIRSFFFAAFAALVTVFGSAVIGPGVIEIKTKWHLGLPVATLTVSLYVVGFAVGPVVWGPLSENSGRWMPMVVGMLGMTIFSYACASAANFQTLVLSRFFAGVFGATSISVGPAIMSDIFATVQRGKAIGVVSLMIFAGPMLAPVIGGFTAASFLGWRWTQYLWGFVSSLSLILLYFLEETYPPKVLAARAKDIRLVTGNWAIHAEMDNRELEFVEIAKRTILKPLKMLFVEPILFLVSVYHGFIYGILYLCLEAVPIVFADYGWKGGNIYLPYIGMLIGSFVLCFVNLFFFEPLFLKRLQASGKIVLPEQRLPLMMWSGLVFPAGIFLFCWSGAYHVQWFVPTLGCALIGFGLLGIFMAAFNYIIDSYLMLAASAIAANTFLRSGFGAAFPLFAHPLFINLHTQWAGTLLGCLAALLAPVPFAFYIWGERIRKMSKFVPDLDELEEMNQIEEESSSHITRRSTNISMVEM